MTLSVTLSPEAEAKLREKAIANGEAPDTYASRLLEKAVTSPSADELLAPFRKQVADSKLSDQELDAFFDDVREKAYQERQSRRA